MKLEDQDRENEMEHHRARNQKRAERRQCLFDHLQQDVGDPHDYSNNDLRNVINIGRDARTIILSKCQEHEEGE